MPAMATETDTIIIGAGPAGLAVGAVLRRANVPFVMLERAQRVGESWRRHYERLHLHTPKRHSALPYRPYPRAYPRYPSRQQVVDYLEDYARAFDLRPEFGREVRRCARGADGAWEVSTDAGPYRGRRVVVATGFSQVPNVPRWPGQETFPGPILHSRDYANGEPFRGGRVLVVGFGNSGAEIALDLVEHGARCAVAVRGGVNVIPRDLLGIPIIVCALACRPLPPRVADAMNALTLRLAVGDLAAVGFAKRDDGPFAQIAEGGRIPVIDVGTLARIRRGEIAVRKGVASFDGPEVGFADGTRERFDAVVLATGFTTGLPAMLPDHASVLDPHGRPRDPGREAAVPGLYFCGYDLATTGLLRQIGIEARRIGQDIAAKAGGARRGVG
jgi:cation diffusion facilitator CzcD-associated flavoprotein CzcO